MRDASPSRTAEIVALLRAAERRRPPGRRILDDPWAHHFLTPGLRATLRAWERSGMVGDLMERAAVGLTSFIAARHRLVDEHLERDLARRGSRTEQVLLLGAGYDMRSHRIVRGRIPVFEVDHPATSRRKTEILQSLREREGWREDWTTPVTMDFGRQELIPRLLEHGFRAGARTFVIWEGVVMYLPRQAVEGTLGEVAELVGAGSPLLFDGWYLLDEPGLRARAHRLSAELLSLLGEPLLFSLHPRDAPAFLRGQGFSSRDVVTAELLRKRYVPDGRAVYPATYVVRASRRRVRRGEPQG